MPKEQFNQVVTRHYRAKGELRDLVRNISFETHLSQQAVAVRIDKLNLLKDNFYSDWRKELRRANIPIPKNRTFNDTEIGEEEEEPQFFQNSSRSHINRTYGWHVLQTLQNGHKDLGISKFDIAAFTGIKPDRFDAAYDFARGKARARLADA
jgi:hypothetical protein